MGDYGEPTASGLWGEPYKAGSDVAFLVASGVLLWLVARRRPAAPVRVWLLPALLGLAGPGVALGLRRGSPVRDRRGRGAQPGRRPRASTGDAGCGSFA